MNPKRASIVLFTLALLCLTTLTATAQVTVGVKAGQYAEYNSSSTGNPMQGHDATWARMDINAVNVSAVNVTFISTLTDGSNETASENLNFATGIYIDYFVVPANLKTGDSFFDSTLGDNVTIVFSEVRPYAGAQRTVVSATTLVDFEGGSGQTTWTWDQATGVLVEADSTYPAFTLHTAISKTDIWSPEITIFGMPAFAFVVIVVLIAAIVSVAAALLVVKRKTAKLSAKPKNKEAG
jgi:hypothetical protein